jgi:hypothetical protein
VPHTDTAEFREFRKGNWILVIAREDTDRYFWQFQEGVRKRLPAASGVSDSAFIAQLIENFMGTEVSF